MNQPPLPSSSAKYVLMPGCPARGRRSQTSTRPALLRSRPNTRPFKRPRFEYAQMALTLSLAPASGTGISDGLLAEITNLIVCVLTDGFTAIERTMMQGGGPDRVLEMRRAFQRMMNERHSEMIEQLAAANARVPQPSTGRTRPHDRDLPDGRPNSRIRRTRARRPTIRQPRRRRQLAAYRRSSAELGAMRLSVISGWPNSRCRLLGSRSRSTIPRQASSVGGGLGCRRRGLPAPTQTLEFRFT